MSLFLYYSAVSRFSGGWGRVSEPTACAFATHRIYFFKESIESPLTAYAPGERLQHVDGPLFLSLL
jgi:hypothetical protein